MIGEIEEPDKLNEQISVKDYKEIASIVRMEVASIFFNLYKKKSVWA